MDGRCARGRALPAWWWWIGLMLASVLAGCGGGGSGGGEPAPSIAVQPVTATAVTGGAATFAVTANGSALGFQWQRSTDAGAHWADIAGATQASYTVRDITAAMNGWQFRVAVSGDGAVVTSVAATLHVSALAPPSITVQPADAAIVLGGDARFSVTAGGPSLTYAWQFSTDGVAWNAVPGATGATLLLVHPTLGDSGRRYRVVVSNAAGSATSTAVLLSVTAAAAAPVILTQPVASISVIAGQTATLSVQASGSPAPDYQWQRSSDGGAHFSDIAGATASSYTLPATTAANNGERFRVRIRNSAGSVTSHVTTLSVGVGEAPQITVQPASAVANFPANDFAPRTATFTAAVTGQPTPTLQWQISTDGGTTFGNVNGANAASYTTPPVTPSDSGRQFRLVASNAAGSMASHPATLYVLNVGLGGFAGGLAVRSNGDIVATVTHCSTFCGAPGDFMGLRTVTAGGAVVTLAGNAPDQIRGDVDGSGGAARFVAPRGIVLDAAGNAIVSDLGHRIRRVTPAGVVSTLAGSDRTGGFVNGQGSLASFNQPDGLALDGGGNLYVADGGNGAIRKVTPEGLVSTLAGGASFGTADGQGAAAQFRTPSGIAYDGRGSLYVSDAGTCTLRKVGLSGSVTTIAGQAGCGQADGALADARFTAPRHLALDASGNLFVVDQFRVRRISASGTVSTLPGGSLGVSPTGLAVDAAGNVYVANFAVVSFEVFTALGGGSYRIRRIAPDGTVSQLP